MCIRDSIWAVDYVKVHASLPTALRRELQQEGADLFTVEMLDRVTPAIDGLAQVRNDPFLLFLEPPSIDDRVVNQYALLSVMSSATERVDDWLAERPEFFARYVIPARLKWEIRDKLDQANVTERVLFPGLDGLSTWLKQMCIRDRRKGVRQSMTRLMISIVTVASTC